MSRGQFRMLRCARPGVEAVEAVSGHRFARHSHAQFGIGVIHRGAQKSASCRGLVEARAGDVLMVNPGEVHDGAPIGDQGRAWRMLYFDPAIVAAATRDITQGRTGTCELVDPVMQDSRVAARAAACFAAMTGDADDVRRDELLLELIASVSRPREAAGIAPGPILPARQRIDDDPAAAVTLEELGRLCQLSRFQLIRAFMRATGLTPHAYIIQRRIDLARRLIGGGLALAEAAADSGFADQSHMTRAFTARYGISPGAYAAAVA